MPDGLNLSCPDWEARLAAGESLVPAIVHLNVAEGRRAVLIFKKLRLADVPGTPTIEEAGADWFYPLVFAIFASRDPITRSRLIRELFLLVPKKNSKTTFGALLMLTALLMNDRPRAEFIFTGPVQDTADTAFAAVEGAIQLDPVLDKLFHVRSHLKTIVHRPLKATLKIATFDPKVLTGKKISGGALVDELHEITKISEAAKVIRQIRGGMIPFPEAFLAFITTQSDGPPTGVFRAELARARSIRDGKIEGSGMLPVLYELPAKIQKDKELWRDPKYWPWVTPNLNKSVTIARLIADFKTAEESVESEGEVRSWASQHLNIQIGLQLLADRWSGTDYWESKVAAEVDLDFMLLACEVIDIGIDGGGSDDLFGLTVVGRLRDRKTWVSWSKAWAHKDVLKLRKEIAVELKGFADDGDLVLVEEIGEDVADAAAIVKRVFDSGLLDMVGLDPAKIAVLYQALLDIKIPKEKIVGISQGWKLVGAITVAQRRLAAGPSAIDGQLLHADQPLMDWCCSNARVVPIGNAEMITKQASGKSKIDPLMALFNAVELMARNPVPPPPPKKPQLLFI